MIIETDIDGPNGIRVECTDKDCVFNVEVLVLPSNTRALAKLIETVATLSELHKEKYPNHIIEATFSGRSGLVCALLVS